MERITILGDGSWGTACASLLAYNNIHVTLWCYNEDVAHEITQHQENRTFLPDIKLNTDYIHPTTSHKEAVKNAQYICFAIPVKYMRSVIENCRPYMQPEQIWISLSKGIEQDTHLLPTQIVEDITPVSISTGVIAGPSFARELAQRKPTGMMCAMASQRAADPLINAFTSDITTIPYTDDVIGTQIGGALKNIYALASGIIDAKIDAYNTAALLTTYALSEMQAIAQVFGGKPETLSSLAGLGDLVLTCQGSHSRNRTVGQKIGSGVSLQDYLNEVDFVPEGINTVTAVNTMLHQQNLDAPIIQAVYDIIHNDASADHLIDTLLAY